MIDADVGSLAFDRPAPRLRDPDTDDLDRLAASLRHIALCCCEPRTNETNDRWPPEAAAMRKQFLINAMPAASEQP